MFPCLELDNHVRVLLEQVNELNINLDIPNQASLM
jgi:hypothetical protein